MGAFPWLVVGSWFLVLGWQKFEEHEVLLEGLAGFDEGEKPSVHSVLGLEAFELPEGLSSDCARGVMGAAKCWHGDFHGLRVLHLNHRHVLMRAGVGFAGPVVEHDGLPQRPWGVADRGALDAGEDFGAEPGVERAFEHGGDRIDGVDLNDRC